MGLIWGLFSVIIASSCAIKHGFCGKSSAADDALMGFYRGSVSFWLDARILLLGLLGYLLSVFVGIKRYINLR